MQIIPINSKSDLFLVIDNYESLVSTVLNSKSDEDSKLYNKTVSKLNRVISDYRYHNILEMAVFRDEKLIGIFSGTSDVKAVKHFEQSHRDNSRSVTDFTVYRTFSYNGNHEYTVGLLKELTDADSSIGLQVQEVAMFKSTLEYFYIEDRFDTSYPTMPI